MARKLTDKQQAFIDEYLIDLNATQAAIRAGYSEETAAVIGSENLVKPNIQKAIQEAQMERRKANSVTREGISKEIDTMMAIAKKHAAEGSTGALSPWLKALETKAKLYGLFNAQTQISIAKVETRPISEIFEQDKTGEPPLVINLTIDGEDRHPPK